MSVHTSSLPLRAFAARLRLLRPAPSHRLIFPIFIIIAMIILFGSHFIWFAHLTQHRTHTHNAHSTPFSRPRFAITHHYNPSIRRQKKISDKTGTRLVCMECLLCGCNQVKEFSTYSARYKINLIVVVAHTTHTKPARVAQGNRNVFDRRGDWDIFRCMFSFSLPVDFMLQQQQKHFVHRIVQLKWSEHIWFVRGVESSSCEL